MRQVALGRSGLMSSAQGFGAMGMSEFYGTGDEAESQATLEAFYRRVRPGGPGWAAVSVPAGFGREPIPGGALAWSNWIAGIVAV